MSINKFVCCITWIILVLTGGTGFSQQVISAGGADVSDANLHLSWTIGEPVIETFSGTSFILTQGFRQGNLTITSLDDLEISSLEFRVYPNPFSCQFHIEVLWGGWNELHYELFSVEGS